MIVLGLDPGTARLGYGLIKKEGSTLTHIEHGCLETPAGMAQASRLFELSKLLDALMERHKPDLVGVEKLFFSKNVKTAMSVSEARGVILLAARSRGVAISEHSPQQVKQAVSGYGGADKKQVQAMITRLLKLAEIPQPDDAADALAIAYCAAVTIPIR